MVKMGALVALLYSYCWVDFWVLPGAGRFRLCYGWRRAGFRGMFSPGAAAGGGCRSMVCGRARCHAGGVCYAGGALVVEQVSRFRPGRHPEKIDFCPE